MPTGKGRAHNVVVRRAQTLLQERPLAIQRSLARPPRLLSILCTACGTYSFPRQAVCPRCGCENVEEACLSGRGRLETFAIIRHALPGYRGPMPYVIGTVTLPEGVRLRALVHSCRPEELRTGMEVELNLAKAREDRSGNDVLIHAFRPV